MICKQAEQINWPLLDRAVSLSLCSAGFFFFFLQMQASNLLHHHLPAASPQPDKVPASALECSQAPLRAGRQAPTLFQGYRTSDGDCLLEYAARYARSQRLLAV